jgi:hypothetical protein
MVIILIVIGIILQLKKNNNYNLWHLFNVRHMHQIKPKGLSLGLGFQFFEYLGLGLGISQISY